MKTYMNKQNKQTNMNVDETKRNRTPLMLAIMNNLGELLDWLIKSKTVKKREREFEKKKQTYTSYT